MASADNLFNFSALALEIKYNVFVFCPFNTLVLCRSVCSEWKHILRKRKCSFWQKIAKQTFGVTLTPHYKAFRQLKHLKQKWDTKLKLLLSTELQSVKQKLDYKLKSLIENEESYDKLPMYIEDFTLQQAQELWVEILENLLELFLWCVRKGLPKLARWLVFDFHVPKGQWDGFQADCILYALKDTDTRYSEGLTEQDRLEIIVNILNKDKNYDIDFRNAIKKAIRRGWISIVDALVKIQIATNSADSLDFFEAFVLHKIVMLVSTKGKTENDVNIILKLLKFSESFSVSWECTSIKDVPIFLYLCSKNLIPLLDYFVERPDFLPFFPEDFTFKNGVKSFVDETNILDYLLDAGDVQILHWFIEKYKKTYFNENKISLKHAINGRHCKQVLLYLFEEQKDLINLNETYKINDDLTGTGFFNFLLLHQDYHFFLLLFLCCNENERYDVLYTPFTYFGDTIILLHGLLLLTLENTALEPILKYYIAFPPKEKDLKLLQTTIKRPHTWLIAHCPLNIALTNPERILYCLNFCWLRCKTWFDVNKVETYFLKGDKYPQHFVYWSWIRSKCNTGVLFVKITKSKINTLMGYLLKNFHPTWTIGLTEAIHLYIDNNLINVNKITKGGTVWKNDTCMKVGPLYPRCSYYTQGRRENLLMKVKCGAAMKCLISKGCNIHFKDEKTLMNVLHVQIIGLTDPERHISSIFELLKSGVNVDDKDKNGASAIMLILLVERISWWKKVVILVALISFGALWDEEISYKLPKYFYTGGQKNLLSYLNHRASTQIFKEPYNGVSCFAEVCGLCKICGLREPSNSERYQQLYKYTEDWEMIKLAFERAVSERETFWNVILNEKAVWWNADVADKPFGHALAEVIKPVSQNNGEESSFEPKMKKPKIDITTEGWLTWAATKPWMFPS